MLGLDDRDDPAHLVGLGVKLVRRHSVPEVDNAQNLPRLALVVVPDRADGSIQRVLLLLAPLLEKGNAVLESGHPHR